MNTREEFLDLYTSLPTSVAANYTDVPPPDPSNSLYLLAAQWQLSDLYAEDTPGLAADLLENGPTR